MSDKRELPIGIFDSGMGGLTVLKAIASLLPAENLLYLGDTARLPYGTKGRDTIVRYTLLAAGKLVEIGVKMLVVACNTATSAALPVLQKEFAPIPVLGVIGPGARAACQASKNGHIAVIATQATVQGGAYQHAIDAINPGAKVTARACTLLVSLAEEGWTEGPIARAVLARYLDDIFHDPDAPDTLLLGCTHFPLFLNSLREVVGEETRIVDSASATAEDVAKRLDELGILRAGGETGKRDFLTTDNPERFTRVGGHFLGVAMNRKQARLGDL